MRQGLDWPQVHLNPKDLFCTLYTLFGQLGRHYFMAVVQEHASERAHSSPHLKDSSGFSQIALQDGIQFMRVLKFALGIKISPLQLRITVRICIGVPISGSEEFLCLRL